MNKGIYFLALLLSGLLMTQCGSFRKVADTEPAQAIYPSESMAGLKGFEIICGASDTIKNVLISKAEALIDMEDNRYEAFVSIYAVKDSLIYLSAVNSGFEIIRASVDHDTIRVIDRINKVVYSSPVRKRLGYQNPVNFADVQNLISRYYLCDDLYFAQELNFSDLGFQFNDPFIKKSILLNRKTLLMDKFEFVHMETGKYFMGERETDGFKIYSNFMVNEIEIFARGGVVSFNQELEVKMDVNRRKYAFMNF